MRSGNIDFGLWLRDKRLDKGLTMEEFSKLCELSYVTISNIELGKVLPGISATKKIADVLEMEYVDLRLQIKARGEANET